MATLEVKGLCREFKDRDSIIHAVDGISYEFKSGKAIAIVGPSGSGKSTLLKMAGLLLEPSSGEIFIDGKNATSLSEREKSHMRNQVFGYVTQDFSIIEDESVYRNIEIPLLYSERVKRNERTALVEAAADAVAIKDKLKRKAGSLSGGEKQRVAIARAIVGDQPILLADEPTGALDKENKEKIIDLLLDQVNRKGKTLVIVTHDENVAARCDSKITISGGKLV